MIISSSLCTARVFSILKEVCGDDAYFLTNTSSIPISAAAEKAGLGGRLIGYHFYNPPAVQRLLEIITT
ncbi:3-hydroxyacyl-CoA dehydrogenase NAD-binding domain-containing protein, partial [Planctomycetota bacterium]